VADVKLETGIVVLAMVVNGTAISVVAVDGPLLCCGVGEVAILMLDARLLEIAAAAATVLLYIVSKITLPSAPLISLRPSTPTEGGSETAGTEPPQLCVGSPGQVVLHAEPWY
jgi:hypothetical protein